MLKILKKSRKKNIFKRNSNKKTALLSVSSDNKAVFFINLFQYNLILRQERFS
jgi:hypothetical protein